MKTAKMRLPLAVGVDVLVRLDGEDLHTLGRDEFVVRGLFGFDQTEFKRFCESRAFKCRRICLLKTSRLLLNLYKDGLKQRVKSYNSLLRRQVIRGPERFASISAPTQSNRFLLEPYSEDRVSEPAYYYPIDERSVDFWNRVHETDAMLRKFRMASLWRQHQDAYKKRHSLTETLDETLQGLVFRMNHRFARVLLNQNLQFPMITKACLESQFSLLSMESSTSSVRSKISFFETLAQ